jgi:hypothetical protein
VRGVDFFPAKHCKTTGLSDMLLPKWQFLRMGPFEISDHLQVYRRLWQDQDIWKICLALWIFIFFGGNGI